MNKSTALLLLLNLLFLGCAGDRNDGVSATLTQEAREKYPPPEDKKITDKQMQMYMAVHRLELEIARNAAGRLKEKAKDLDARKEKPGIKEGWDALDDIGSFINADLHAAKELGYNTAEYQWVKAQILEAGASAVSEEFQQATNRSVERSMGYYKEQLAKAETSEEKQMWQQNIQSLSRQHAEMQKSADAPDPVRHNREVIWRYRSELDTIRSEMSNYAAQGKADTKQPR